MHAKSILQILYSLITYVYLFPVLDLKLKKEDVNLVTGSFKGIKDNNKGIVFDWIPPDVPKDLVCLKYKFKTL